jgi:hypothetical protein
LFDSPEAAAAAAAKLVKEKTGKGYIKVGGAAAPPAAKAGKASKPTKVAREAPAPTPAAPPAGPIGELPEWLTEPMLAELCAKPGKKSKRSPSELADAVVGTDEGGTWGRGSYRSNAAIAILIDRGRWPEKLIPEVLREAIFGWAFMRPETLLGLIQRPDFDESLAELALMRLGTAEPALLEPARDSALPPGVARLAPLVRRRLGLSREPLSDELADRLAAAFMRGSGSAGGQIERAGRCLVDRYFSSYQSYREYVVASFGINDWDERVKRAAEKDGFGAAWRAEPVFLSAPVGELAELLANAGELTRQLLDGITWPHLHDKAACLGRLGLEHLPDLLERQARESSKREFYLAIQTMLVNAAELAGEPFGAEHDAHFDPRRCHDKTAWQRAVAMLPPERRDAYLLAWARLDPFELQPQLQLVSDQTLDQIVGLMFAMRAADRVNVTYPKGVSFDAVGCTLHACGERVLPMIEKHYRESGGDEKARELLAAMPLQPEVYAALTGR